MNLLELPREIRDHIYSFLLSPSANKHTTDINDNDNNETTTTYTYTHCSFLLTNRQIYNEARHSLLTLNSFIKISTPFLDAHHYVAGNGVATIIAGAQAESFCQHRMAVVINCPSLQQQQANDADKDNNVFVIHIDDLVKFCDSWFYSAIDRPDLNSHLTLTLDLRDPLCVSALSTEENSKEILPSLQKSLLLPFGRVKNLLSMEIKSTHPPTSNILHTLHTEQKTPIPPPATLLLEATAHKDNGNKALMANQPSEALTHYTKAWSTLFITVKGRTRKTHGEAYFQTTLTTPGPYENQHGGMVYMLLRIRLVANTLLAYLKLCDWESVMVIGMRTINLIRRGDEGLEPEEEAWGSSWVAGPEMGKIYYRTAVAFGEVGQTREAWKLLRVAVLCLPNDVKVKELLNEFE
jgi:hypothetical protein